MQRRLATFFLLWVQHSLGIAVALHNFAPRTELRQEQMEPLRHVAIIKAEILRRLGIPDTPTYDIATPTRTAKTNQKVKITEYKLADVASYHSEPADNFTDENIIQFRLSENDYGSHIEINSVNLLVRIKLRKEKPKGDLKTKRDSKSNKKQKRKKKLKEINLYVSSVTADGKPGVVITSVKSKLRKTKSLKLNLPKELVQNVLDSKNRTLQVFVQCIGCDKKAKMILVRKRRKRKRTKSRLQKLHKRRPILFVQSHITSGR